MNAWQWVVTICLPILTIDHCAMTVWNILRRTDKKEIAAMEKRDKEWQSIFQSIDKSFVMTGKKLVDTWIAMKIVTEHLEKLILKKTERNKPPENPFGYIKENKNV